MAEWKLAGMPSEALERACAKIADYAPDALVVPLGVDTLENDTISFSNSEGRFQTLWQAPPNQTLWAKPLRFDADKIRVMGNDKDKSYK